MKTVFGCMALIWIVGGAPALAQPSATGGEAAPPLTIQFLAETQRVNVDVTGFGRRTLLLALAAQAGVRVLYADDLPDEPADYTVERAPLTEFVARLLTDAGTDYVMVLRRDIAGGVRGVVVAKRGPVAVATALASFDEDSDGLEEQEAAKAKALAEEAARPRTTEEALRALERTLRAEGEPIPPRIDLLASPPVIVELPASPVPTPLGVAPIVRPAPMQPIPLEAPQPSGWRPVSPEEVMPGAGERRRNPPGQSSGDAPARER